MAESGGVREYDVKDLLKELEKDSNSPGKRALGVFGYLQNSEFTDYDILCFSVEFIAMRSGEFPWLKENAKALIKLLYLMHVTKFGDIECLTSTTLQGSKGTPTPSSGT